MEQQQIAKIKIIKFKNCGPFTDCISETNNTQVVNAKDLHAIIRTCNLLDYIDYYSKISASL